MLDIFFFFQIFILLISLVMIYSGFRDRWDKFKIITYIRSSYSSIWVIRPELQKSNFDRRFKSIKADHFIDRDSDQIQLMVEVQVYYILLYMLSYRVWMVKIHDWGSEGLWEYIVKDIGTTAHNQQT